MHEVKKKHPYILHAFCLMPNHFHLLIQRLTVSLSTILQRIQCTYAIRLNRRRNQTGHLFQGRFKDVPCESDQQYQNVIRYIHYNAVRAGLVVHLEQWDWSSHNAYNSDAGANYGIVDTPVGLGILGPNDLAARYNYAELMGKDLTKDDLDLIRNSISENRNKQLETVKPPLNDSKATDIGALARIYCRETDISVEEITGPSRARFLTPMRRHLTQIAIREGFSMSQIASLMNRTPGSISRLIA